MARTDIFNTDDLDLETTEINETETLNEGDNEVTNAVATPEPEDAPENTEATAEATESTEDKKAKQAQADAEHLPAVEEFKTVVEAAVEAADESTGTVSVEDLEKIAVAYREVKGGIKYKNLAKAWVTGQMSASIKDNEFTKAVSYNEVNEHLNTQVGNTGPAAPKVDPKIAYAERLAAFELTVDLLGAHVPEGAEDFEPIDTTAAFNQAQEFIAWDAKDEEHRGDEPEVGPIAAAALKLFHGKGLGARRVGAKSTTGGGVATYSGPRRNVANHINSAFEGVASGTFLKISDIAAHKSEEYGDAQPSSGAIAARLFPSSGKPCTIEGITPGEDSNSIKGATKN